MSEVVMYCFAGRKENLLLQMPLYQRVLDEHPEVQIDIWKLTRLKRDAEFVERISGHPRLRVRTDFQRVQPWWKRFDHVWRHYTHKQYRDTLFVKIDDDVVFWETDRFGDFLQAAREAPGTISSALTINNGASAPLIPGMQHWIDSMDLPLLDVHLSGEWARAAHDHAIANWDELIGMPVVAKATEDWLSINMIAYDWETGCRVTKPLGEQPALHIAGRDFTLGQTLGDEGSCNMQPRQIVQGFLAAHLTFGPQELPADVWQEYRNQYAALGRAYLDR